MNVKKISDDTNFVWELAKKIGFPNFITIFIIGFIFGGFVMYFYYSKQIEIYNTQEENCQNEINKLNEDIKAYEQTLNMKLFPHEITYRKMSHLKFKKHVLGFVNQLRKLINNYDLKSRTLSHKYVNLSGKIEDWDKKIEYMDEQFRDYMALSDSLKNKYEKDSAMKAFLLRNELLSRRNIMNLPEIRVYDENFYLHPNGNVMIIKIGDQLELMAKKLPDTETYLIPPIE